MLELRTVLNNMEQSMTRDEKILEYAALAAQQPKDKKEAVTLTRMQELSDELQLTGEAILLRAIEIALHGMKR
jgi:hypothetical protein